jgi:hypothetical protein
MKRIINILSAITLLSTCCAPVIYAMNPEAPAELAAQGILAVESEAERPAVDESRATITESRAAVAEALELNSLLANPIDQNQNSNDFPAPELTLESFIKVKTGITQEMIYECTACVYSTPLGISQLKSHIRSKHLSDGAFKCRYCQEDHASNALLKKHVINTHDFTQLPRTKSKYKHQICFDGCKKIYSDQKTYDAHSPCRTTGASSSAIGDIADPRLAISADVQAKLAVQGVLAVASELERTVVAESLKPNSLLTDLVKPNHNPNASSLTDPGLASASLAKEKTSETQINSKFECTECDFCVTSMTLLKEHIQSKHMKNGAYKCTYCGQKYAENRSLQYHLLKIHDLAPIKHNCPYCIRNCVTEESLKNHLIYNHSFIQLPTPITSNGYNPHICFNGCKKIYPDPASYDAHLPCTATDLDYPIVPAGHDITDSSLAIPTSGHEQLPVKTIMIPIRTQKRKRDESNNSDNSADFSDGDKMPKRNCTESNSLILAASALSALSAREQININPLANLEELAALDFISS